MKTVDAATIGPLKGEILAFLDGCGGTTVGELTRMLERPLESIQAAVECLEKEGAVRVTKDESRVAVELGTKAAEQPPAVDSPEVWGG